MEEVLRRTSLVPLAFPCFALCLIRVETDRLLDYQGRAVIISIVRWNLRPVIFGVDLWAWRLSCRNSKQSQVPMKLAQPFPCPRIQEKKKHININKFAGLSQDWGGAKNLFMCFFRVIPYGGKNT